MEAARRTLRPASAAPVLRKAATAACDATATPCGSTTSRCARRRAGVLAAPTLALAEAIAAEWDAQRDLIDPAKMPLTRLANSIIDGVADAPRPVADEIAKYLGVRSRCSTAPARRRGSSSARRAIGTRSSTGRAQALGAAFQAGRGASSMSPSRRRRSPPRAPRSPRIRGGSAPCTSSTTLTGSALIALALAHGALVRRRRVAGRPCRRGLEHGSSGAATSWRWSAATFASPSCRRRRRCWPGSYPVERRLLFGYRVCSIFSNLLPRVNFR